MPDFSRRTSLVREMLIYMNLCKFFPVCVYMHLRFGNMKGDERIDPCSVGLPTSRGVAPGRGVGDLGQHGGITVVQAAGKGAYQGRDHVGAKA